jgi:23S rRNA-/tRNA-specific pseudouridylate synthase
VHRIDKDTSGIIGDCKTRKWMTSAKQFEAKPPKENMLLWFGEMLPKKKER